MHQEKGSKGIVLGGQSKLASRQPPDLPGVCLLRLEPHTPNALSFEKCSPSIVIISSGVVKMWR